MGIFKFVREAGSKVGIGESPSKAEAEAAKDEELHELREGNKLLRFIMQMDLGVENPKVKYDDGVATVTGTAPTQKVRENVILAIGNCAGVEAVDDRMEVREAAPEATFYTVKKGDTLGAIAKEHLGSAKRYTEIFEANQPLLKDPNLIYPGQVLRIPAE
ncbi:MAG: peptidoglycan-binding protein LysM [Gemmatimonadota bacterium]|nr:peptidoglycan-binding protein LysM [Gemmatimonadota bacterium]MDH3424565.1 peptidoglycan-binding protein LysM [Gemmatimonadota bacterium]